MDLSMRHAKDTDIAALRDLMGQLEEHDPDEMRNRLQLLAGRVDHQLFVCEKTGPPYLGAHKPSPREEH